MKRKFLRLYGFPFYKILPLSDSWSSFRVLKLQHKLPIVLCFLINNLICLFFPLSSSLVSSSSSSFCWQQEFWELWAQTRLDQMLFNSFRKNYISLAILSNFVALNISVFLQPQFLQIKIVFLFYIWIWLSNKPTT